jgi:hypothetical protein
MSAEGLVFCLLLVLVPILSWAFKYLPGEKWQIMAAVPASKEVNGEWKGFNLTYYGFFTASAYALSVAAILFLMGSLDVPWLSVLMFLIPLLAVSMPASSLMARWVEKKRHTFSVGGASFVALVIAPGVCLAAGLLSRKMLHVALPVLPALASLTIAYAIGEGFGRLACISFGCCFGKPLSKVHSMFRFLFSRVHFSFSGKNKKAAYEAGLENEPLVPIQAITSVLCLLIGLSGIYLFLEGYYRAAYLGTLTATQAWRTMSEFLRADYRGGGTVSQYQKMALLSVPYCLAVVSVLPAPSNVVPIVQHGLSNLWNPGVILFIQILWIVAFLQLGRSEVTGAIISLHVIRDRI